MRVMVVFDYLRWSEQDAALVEIQSAFQRSFPGFSVAMRGCWGSSTCLIEVRTELDETTDAGLASLGRLANCNRVLRECLFDRIVASEGPVRQMTYMAGPEEPRPSASPRCTRVASSSHPRCRVVVPRLVPIVAWWSQARCIVTSPRRLRRAAASPSSSALLCAGDCRQPPSRSPVTTRRRRRSPPCWLTRVLIEVSQLPDGQRAGG